MLAFLQTRLGCALAAALAVAILTFTVTARYYDRAAEVTALKSQIAARDFDIKMAQDAAFAAAKRAETLQQKTTENQGYVDALEQELAARPGRDACRLTGDDADWLRRIK